MVQTSSLELQGKRGLFSRQVPFSDRQNRILNLFFYTMFGATFAALLGAVLYYVYAYAALSSGSHSFDWLLGIFSDFVFIMNVSLEESPYLVEDSSYPPIAIAVLYPFALICKGVFAKYANQVLTVDELTSRVILHWQFWVAMILFFLICSAAIILIVIREYRLTPKVSVKLGWIILVSAPFVYAIMRGNTIYFAMIFLLLFLMLHKSNNAVLREIGYISLAISGLIKIYPLFFGVFLLHKKKIWASCRVAIYTLIGFVLSFWLFRGIDDLGPFIDNLGGFASNNVRLIAGNNLSVTSLLYKVFHLFSPTVANGAVFDAVNIAILTLIFLAATFLAIYTKNSFSRYIIASAIVVLIPSISYFYVLIFMLPPFMEFLRGYDQMEARKRKIYTALFGFLLFTPLIITQFFIFHSLVVIAMLAMESTQIIREEILKKKGA